MPDFLKSESSPAEYAPTPETGREAAPETAPAAERPPSEDKISEAAAPAPVADQPVAEPALAADPVVASIEAILAEDLYEHFKAMPPRDRARFRQKGDETVAKLAGLIGRAAIKAKEVLSLVAAWLKLIPGVNKYFLEQESKIKTDKILELHKRQHGG